MDVSEFGSAAPGLRRKAKAAILLLSLLLLATADRAPAQESGEVEATRPGSISFGPPIELQLKKAGSSDLDLRSLPQTPPEKEEEEREEREEPEPHPVELRGGPTVDIPAVPVPGPTAPAPAPLASFDGLDFATWGAGHPPDTVGDVGPTYYIQAVNTSIGIYLKTGGAPVAAFTFNTFMSQGAFGNLCDTNNFGDPVVLYDSFEDRWVLTDFAFTTSGGAVVNPPGAFQCFAVSKTGDPVSGGWNFYSINTAGGLGDYPKFAIWPDGIYMSANMFGYASGAPFQNSRVYALNKAQMYAGSPTVQVVTFNAPSADFTLLPSNARLQTGTPPIGAPNYFVSTWQFLNALTVYKMHVDWDKISTSTFTGPDVPLAATSWPNANVPNALSQGGNALDVLQIRAMMQNQYTNLGGVESLWATHTVRRGDTTGFAAPRWYQVDVTGGTVAANLPQAATWDPDGANVMSRFIPSLAVDRAGDMAIGYSTSSSTTKPALKYAGRLVSDPVNTLGQTEQLLIQGTGTQTGTCGGVSCTRWGDYSAMSLDPDGCRFWFTSMYYAVDGLNDLTRIGSFSFPSCTPVGAGGTLSGTVTATVGGAPISGATVALGNRVTTTDGSGVYSFTGLPAGTYQSLTVTKSGLSSASATNLAISDAATTTQNFSLATAPATGCQTDTAQADFQRGLPTNVDLTISAGDVVLFKPSLDQLNETISTSGVGITTTTWGGQTFTPAVSGLLTAADINLFCSACTGTTPNLTLSVRATSGGFPTGADLSSATITGFSNGGVASNFSVTFGSPATLTAGTMYALVIRPVTNPSVGTYALTRSATNVYAGGTRVQGATSGTVWTSPLTSGQTTDIGFHTFMDSGFAPSGNQVSALFDSNPAPGLTPIWQTLSWTAATPANTSVQLQVAGSTSPTGPFNFVGPDGTAGTFFTTTGASLTPQFDGKRYLKYKAYLATTNSAVSPALNSVSLCFVNATPDLSITKSDGGASVSPGGTVAYTLTYANAGPPAATGVVLTETVPANTTFNAGASTAGWVCAPNNNAGSTCTLAVGSLAAGGGSTATFAVTVINPVGAGVTQISNTASISDDGTHGIDAATGNNSGSDTTPVSAAPDLSLTKSDGGASVAPGGTVAYTLTYANNGSTGSTGVVLTETVPANTTFNAGASTAGWVCTPNNNAGSTCTLAIGALAAGGGNQTATFAVTVVNPVAAGVTQISNTASISDDGANGTDPTPGNNSGSDTTPLSGAPDLSLTKSDGAVSTIAGGTVSYTLTYANGGNRGAAGVTLTETVPANTTFNAGASTAGWSCTPNNNAGSTCTLTIGALAAGGGNQTATFAVTVGSPLPGGVTQISNTASISDDGANGTDPTPGNNSGSDTTPVVPPPVLTSIAPTSGTTAGGTTVTLTGTGFANGATVLFGAVSGTSVTFNNSTSLTANTPAQAAGVVSVTVTNPDTQSSTLGSAYTYIAPTITGYFYSLTPCRIVDTRGPNGPAGGPALVGGAVRSFTISGACGVPTDATAVTINVTVVGPTAAGDLRIFPTGITPPVVSTLNFSAGQTRANNAVMNLEGAPPGSIDVQVGMTGPGTTHFILDVTGYIK